MEFEDITSGGVERHVKGLEGSQKDRLKWFGRSLIKGSKKFPKKGKWFVAKNMEGKSLKRFDLKPHIYVKEVLDYKLGAKSCGKGGR